MRRKSRKSKKISRNQRHRSRRRSKFMRGGSKLISTRDPSFIRYWFVTIDEDVPKIKETSYQYVADLIEKILNDPRGLKRGGYEFKRLDPKSGSFLRQDEKNWINVFHIRLSSGKTVTKNCGFKGLSCADLSRNEIFLNDKNWIYGTEASGMKHEEYIWYVVSHEILHLLGRGHGKWPDDPNKPCPLSTQQTIKKHPNVCRPNVWPLDSDFDL